MSITKTFGPSNVSYGQAVYGSAQNQERYKRAMENLGGAYSSNADAKYKLGMLELEKDKWSKQYPLMQKELDLAEVETWLKKSIAYFEARAQAASIRLSDRAAILQAGEVGATPESSTFMIGASQRSLAGARQNSSQAPLVTSQINQRGHTTQKGVLPASPAHNVALKDNDYTQALSAVDSQYRSELARIDEVYGISQGWTPQLFITGASESWLSPPATPAFGQDPLTGTQPRNDPGASTTPIA